jgi:hypothetical protein
MADQSADVTRVTSVEWCHHRRPQASFSPCCFSEHNAACATTNARVMEEHARNHAPPPSLIFTLLSWSLPINTTSFATPVNRWLQQATTLFDMQIPLFLLFIKPLLLAPPLTFECFLPSRISVTSLLLPSSHPLLIPFVIPLSHPPPFRYTSPTLLVSQSVRLSISALRQRTNEFHILNISEMGRASLSTLDDGSYLNSPPSSDSHTFCAL